MCNVDPRPVVKSVIVDGVFMLCGSTRLMELIDYNYVISLSTIKPWWMHGGLSSLCLMDEFKVGNSTYYEATLGGMPCLYSQWH